MTVVLGFDPSARKVAAVAWQPLTQTFHVHAGNLYPKGTTKQTPESIAATLPFMRDFLEAVAHMAPEGQRFAYVEEPLVGPGIAAAIKQTYVGGVIRACLVEAGYRVYDAHPSRWRKDLGITGRGKGWTKPATKAWLKIEQPKIAAVVGDDGDLIDAAGIALYGAEQVRKAGLLVPAGPAGGAVQGRRPDVVVRPPRVRRPVRR